MRVAVIGCGAVGSLFAANLACLDDVEVWAFDLNEHHVAAINRDGLRLTGAGDVTGHLRATADPAAIPPCDFGIVATKAMHTESAIAATAHAFADGCVATVQNGLGNEETLAAGVELHDDPWEMNVLATERGDRHFPSMLEDVEARRPTEVESINGALVREARRHGVSVPLHDALYRLVKAKEASYSE